MNPLININNYRHIRVDGVNLLWSFKSCNYSLLTHLYASAIYEMKWTYTNPDASVASKEKSCHFHFHLINCFTSSKFERVGMQTLNYSDNNN